MVRGCTQKGPGYAVTTAILQGPGYRGAIESPFTGNERASWDFTVTPVAALDLAAIRSEESPFPAHLS